MKIKSITPKQNQRGSWWLIRTDEDGRRGLATTDMFTAALAERARDTGAEVRILTSSGWFYDNISHLELLATPTQGRGNTVAGERETWTPGPRENDPGTFTS